MLDISRNKVPTMATLYSLVDLLAGLKINHLQLYTEHTFAYSAPPGRVGGREPDDGGRGAPAGRVLPRAAHRADAQPELLRSPAELAPLPRYRDLAECLEGFEWPWGGRSEEPFSLDPSNPASLKLLEGLFDELLPNFDSRLFNVGCDETFDLGQGRSRRAVRARSGKDGSTSISC